MLGHRGDEQVQPELCGAGALRPRAAYDSGHEEGQHGRGQERVREPAASHGLVDAMTNGGLGVAFFAPFSDTRYFFSWRPILVSPISLHVFFGYHGVWVMRSELGWIWLPATLIFLAGLALRRPLGGPTSRRLP
jgi:hypothetical protein